MSKIIIPEGQDLLDALYIGECICNNCGAIMDRRRDPKEGYDILKCPNCGDEVNEFEYEYEADEDEDDAIPVGCAACGGPYPQCTISCKLFDD